jgi:hypothetical protein
MYLVLPLVEDFLNGIAIARSAVLFATQAPITLPAPSRLLQSQPTKPIGCW